MDEESKRGVGRPRERTAPPRSFGAWLAQARRTAGFSPAELAAKAGVGVASVHRWEGGSPPPALAVVMRVVAALGLRLADFEEFSHESGK